MDLRLGGGLNLFIGHTLPLCGMKAMLWTPISVLHPSYTLCSLRCPTLAAALGHTHTRWMGKMKSSIILHSGWLSISPLHPFCLKKINRIKCIHFQNREQRIPAGLLVLPLKSYGSVCSLNFIWQEEGFIRME